MTGLVGWWPLHEQSGDANDLSGNGNHGTVNGATQAGSYAPGGMQAYSFDGVDDYVQTPVNFTEDTTPFSVCAWIYPDTLSGNQHVVAGRDAGSSVPNFIFGSNSGALQFSTYNGTSNSTGINSGGSLSSATWTHIAGTYDNGNWTTYIDGVEDATASGTAYTKAVNDGIGAMMPRDANHFDGRIFDVRHYDRALSAAEVQTLYEWGAAGLGSIPEQDKGGVAYYKLDGDGSDSWGDNNGTLVNDVVAATGIRNEALSFDGNDDSVQISSPNSSLDMDTWSVSAWFKPDSAQDSKIVIKRDDGNPNQNFAIEIFSNGIIRVNHTISNSFKPVDSPSDSYTDGEWNHVIGTNDGTDIRIYLNGNLIATGSGDGGISDQGASQELRIGENTNNGDDFSGEIDEVRIYNRALGGDEVKALYSYDTGGNLLGELAKPPTNANGGVSWYEFRGDASDSWGDNDGTVNGATFVSNAGPRGQGAYSFDGTDDRIVAPYRPEFDSNTFTFSVWINPDDLTNGQRIQDMFSGNDYGWSVRIADNGSNTVELIYEDNLNITRNHYSNTELITNNWQHISLTHDNGLTTHYRNGVFDGSTDVTGNPPADVNGNLNFWFGRNQQGGDAYGGDMTDIRFYNTILSHNQIINLYRYGTLGRDMRELTVNAR